MFPLFIKDGLILPFITTSVVFNAIVYIFYNKKSNDNCQFWPCWKQLIPVKFSKLFEKIFRSIVISFILLNSFRLLKLLFFSTIHL